MTSPVTSPAAVVLNGLVSSFDAGATHVCAILVNASLRCWGDNANGQLGIGTTVANLPAPGTKDILTGVQQVACGTQFTCALLVNGTVRCWGVNNYGQLGINSTVANTTSPGTYNVINSVYYILAGANSACAANTTGWLLCWGSNQYGQLGAYSTPVSPFPRAVCLSRTRSLTRR